ncbi:lysosomal alpha-mannosidase-like [Lepeophtheirus salmonis]|uniref:lysosomal alpha-mannosidase-like n=1 Tax=Lepeophtheirus salmonis TaxID=72036 RepID=UPI001AE246F3|nr:lysosomal alpha-mannosidase-like [Lepeophtheirus salmonis]
MEMSSISKTLLFLLLLSCNLNVSIASPSCHPTKENAINVHFMPHTHDDVGWLKTVDEYYYGGKKEIDPSGVQYILDSVIKALEADEKRRFIYVEMAFFWRWWIEQSEGMRKRVKNLVDEGRLEFINGGWSMNDEAAAHYNAIIDQMSLGLRFLNDTFGESSVPEIAWQIDPFGHAKEQANIFFNMGFKGLFFGRADHADIAQRRQDKSLEMLWESRPGSSRLFTGILPNLYQPPNGFCFDVFCGDDAMVDNLESPEYNIPQKMKAFLKVVLDESKVYATNQIPMTMGGDFQYTDASMWFKNMDKVMKYFKHEKINILYSTPSCYAKAVKASMKGSFPIKTDDFFPYSNDPHSYWTGYFTSRPSLKGMIRVSNNILQACKQMDVIAHLHSENVMVMKRALGVTQHHDAVTGTGKQAVTNDYASRLSIASEKCYDVMNSAYLKLSNSNQVFCPLLNISECQFSSSQSKDFYVNVYNPTSHPQNYNPHFPGNGNYEYFIDGSAISTFPISKSVMNIPGRSSFVHNEINVYFEAKEVLPMSFKTFKVNVSPKKESKVKENESLSRVIGDSNFKTNIILDSHGNIKGLKSPEGIFRFNVKFAYYIGHSGNNSFPKERASGAYIFRPLSQVPIPFPNPIEKPIIRRSKNVIELELKYSNWTSLVTRIFRNEEYFEFEWLVGPIPTDNNEVGKEIVLQYTSKDIRSQNTFYTDSNGRQYIKRKKDFRSTWKLDLSTEPVSRNYYPITSAITVEDSHIRMALLTDRSQGGTSLKDGGIETMIHRRLLFDDAFGVNEALNETAFGKGLVVRGKHWLLFEKPESKAPSRFLSIKKYDDCIVSFSDSSKALFVPLPPLNHDELPQNVHILTLERVSNGILIRFEHFFDDLDDKVFSKPVEFNLRKIFSPSVLPFKSIQEVSLGGNFYLSKTLSDTTVRLKPMEIRSYILN